jgi:gluconokinase
VSDNAYAIMKAAEHLGELGHTSISYLAGPEASWADGHAGGGLKRASVELDLQVRRLGPFLPDDALFQQRVSGRFLSFAWAGRQADLMDATAEPLSTSGKTAVVVMGVAGSGKSTIADLFAQQLGWIRIEGDDLHPPENVAKMAAGAPLTDVDRKPWLRRICERINQTEGNQVITCSALRSGYRDILRTADARVRFLHLSGSTELLAARIGARTDHFMPPSLLTSQLDALEPLTADEDGVTVDVQGTPAEIVARALQALDLTIASPAEDPAADDTVHHNTKQQ